VVLRTRKMLSRDGIVVVIVALNKQTGELVGRPDIVSRGFMDTQEFDSLVEESRDVLVKTLEHIGHHTTEWSFVSSKVRDSLDKFYYDRTKRRPMILPFMVKV
jgi:ribonuclease J